MPKRKATTNSLNLRLKKVYFTAKDAGSFGGKKKLYRRVKDVSHSKIDKWVSDKDTYSLHRPVKRKFERRKYIVSGIDSTFQADLTDLVQFVDENDNYRYILFCIDVFSRYAWVRPLKTKSGQEIVKAFESILKQDNRQCLYLHTDKGKEFFNKDFLAFLKQRNITIYTTENQETKAAIVERLQRTVKSSMFRYFTYTDQYRWIDILQDLITSYNNTYHSSIAMAPSNVTYQNQEDVWNIQHNKKTSLKLNTVFKFKIGDTVRISKYSTVFKKGYLPSWSDEIFIVSKTHHTIPPVYSLQDQAGEILKGSWYEAELQKVKTDNVYKIESILGQRKLKGKTQYLVKWRGYPDSFNSYVDKKDIVTNYKN